MTTVDALAVTLTEGLQAAGFDCALGGALALGFWAIPRGTVDVDITVFVDPNEAEGVVEVLESLACALDREDFLNRLAQGQAAVAHHNRWRIDVFFPSIPFYAKAQQRIQTGVLLGKEIPVLDPESLAVFKLLCFRPKDLVALAALVASQGSNMDCAWVRQEIVGMMGDQDMRVQEWDRLVLEHGDR